MNIIKKCFGKLQYKFFFMFVLLSLIPIAALTVFTVDIYKANIKTQTESNAVFQLRVLDGTIYEKVKNIQRFSDLVKLNLVISRSLGSPVKDYITLDSAMKSTASSCEGIKGVIFFFPDGETYMHNIDDSFIDTVRLRVLFNSSAVTSGALTWYDLSAHSEKTGISDKLMVAGTAYEYTDSAGNTMTADMYILADKSLFGDVLTNFGGNHVGIVNKNGGIIISDDDEFFNQLLKSNIETADKIYNTDEAVFEWRNGKNNTVSVYTSKLTGFKYINASEVESFYKPVKTVTKTAVIIAVVLLALFLLLYIFIVKKITTSITKISDTMKNFDESSLTYRFPVESNDEVGDIAFGFNKMMDSLNEMIDEINKRKDMQKDTEIKALSYQINPHFLYNAVGSIRIEAMNNNDMRVAESLMNLSKIFTISREVILWYLERKAFSAFFTSVSSFVIYEQCFITVTLNIFDYLFSVTMNILGFILTMKTGLFFYQHFDMYFKSIFVFIDFF